MNRLFGKKSEEAQIILVLGGGIAGASFVREMFERTKKFNIFLIDSREAAVWKPAGTRAVVEGPTFAHKVCINLQNLIPDKNGRLVHEAVKEVQPVDTLTLENGQKLRYDYLVCATGSTNRSPCEPPRSIKDSDEMKAHFYKMSAMVLQSASIMIVGTGPVAIELAGEIKEKHKDKNVFLISPDQKLLQYAQPPPPKKFFEQLDYKVAKKGIKLYLDQVTTNITIDDFEGNSYLYGRRNVTTSAGDDLEVDLIFLAIGSQLNNEIYPSNWLDESGGLKVRPTLQLTMRDNVFALGDIANLQENKQGFVAEKHAKIVADNILSLSKNKLKLKSYYPSDRTDIIIPIGRSEGISYVGGRLWGAVFTKRSKGGDLFVNRSWGLYNSSKELKKANKLAKKAGITTESFVDTSAMEVGQEEEASMNGSEVQEAEPAYDFRVSVLMPYDPKQLHESDDLINDSATEKKKNVPPESPRKKKKHKKKKAHKNTSDDITMDI